MCEHVRFTGVCCGSQVREVFDSEGSEQHVLVVYCPLATPIRFELIVRVPLRDDGSVGVGVAEKVPPTHRLAPTQWRRGCRGGLRDHAGAGKRVNSRLVKGAGSGNAGAGGTVGGAGGRELTGAASPAAVSQAGLRAPAMEGERDQESA